MKLINIFRSLLSERKEEKIDFSKGFSSKADSQGLNFYLPTPVLDALRNGDGSTLRKVQLTVLNMLLEQGVAGVTANGFYIAAEDVAAMDNELVEILRLPELLLGDFQTKICGWTGSTTFKILLSVKMPDGTEIFNFERKGPYLFWADDEYHRLTVADLKGLQAWELHNSLEPEQKSETANLRLIAELQAAKREGMCIDLSHFERIETIRPDSVGIVATYLPDGSLSLCPNFRDGSDSDELNKRWSQLDMNANEGVLRVQNKVLLLDRAKMEGVSNVLMNKRIAKDKLREFIATPTAFLNAALVDLEVGFSIRIAGVGKIQHMDFGTLDATKNDWFALDRKAASPEILQKLIQSPEELARFEEILAVATKQGADSLLFAGELLDISNQIAIEQQLSSIRNNLMQSYEAVSNSHDIEESPVTELKEQVGVILKDVDVINSTLLRKAAAASPLIVPDWSRYARKPYPHQQEGITWMLKLLGAALQGEVNDLYRLQGGLLADDMGLGKTYMSLVAASEYINSQRVAGRLQKPVLVVAPLSLLENWEEEVGKTFTENPFRDVILLQSGRDLGKFKIKNAESELKQLSAMIDESGMLDERAIRFALNIGPEAGNSRLDMDRRLVLTTYQTLRDYQFSLCRIDWGIVIFDEAQNIKNPNALQTRAAKGLKADFKLLATGTPVENTLGDFWCLMDTAQPGLLGSWEVYRDTWIKPILNAAKENVHEVQNNLGEQLRRAVGLFMLRRVKEDQLNGLPLKKILCGVRQNTDGVQHYAQNLSLMMKGQQLKAYNKAIDDYRIMRASPNAKRGLALKTLTQLRLISLHPRLDHELELYSQDAKQARYLMMESGKLEILLNLLDDIRCKNEKVILFMITKRLQRVIKLWLDQIYKLNVAIINGDAKAVESVTSRNKEEMTRKKIIDAFEKSDGFNILIMSPIAAGIGLTVVGANHVVHLERHWNPAKEAQASDRVYRIGQIKDVFIYLPIVAHPQFDSFDVHLDRLLRGKVVLKDAVVVPESVSESEMIQLMAF